MARLEIHYAAGPLKGRVEPQSLEHLKPDRVMSIGSRENARFHLPDAESRHAIITAEGSEDSPRYHVEARDDAIEIQSEPGNPFKWLHSGRSFRLRHGVRFRIGQHVFEAVDPEEALMHRTEERAAQVQASPHASPAATPPQMSGVSVPGTSRYSSRPTPVVRLLSNAAAGIKSLFTARPRKEPARVLYQVTSEDRPRASIPKPVTNDLQERHRHVLERVVNYGRQSAYTIAQGRVNHAHRARMKAEYGSDREQADRFYDELRKHRDRIGNAGSGSNIFYRSEKAFIQKLQVRDPSDPRRTRLLTEQEIEFGTRVITRNLEGKTIVDLAVVPKIHEGKLVGHEVHVMLPQLIKAGQRIAKQLARFYKHDVHLVAYPFIDRAGTKR